MKFDIFKSKIWILVLILGQIFLFIIYQDKFMSSESDQTITYNVSQLEHDWRDMISEMEIASRHEFESIKSNEDAILLFNKHLDLKREIHIKQLKREYENINNFLSKSGRMFFQSHWEPSWKCPFEERIGNIGDGGKWVCDPFTIKEKGSDCQIISIGSNNDFSFEESIHELNPFCKIYVFDHTVSKPTPPPYVQFFSFGLGPQNNFPIITLDTAIRIAQINTENKIDIFKIDCEGCEYDVYSQFISKNFILAQILIEIHWRDSRSANNLIRFLTDHNYAIFHKEPNIAGCGGDCVEFGFLKLFQDNI
jgi:hypothetical protein